MLEDILFGQLAMPAMIINRDWRIHYFNEHLIRLYGVTPEQLAAIAPHQMNILHLLFDPRLPLYPRLIQNRASWTRMARRARLHAILCLSRRSTR